MKLRVLLLSIVAVTLFFGNSITKALNLPPVIPPSTNWDTYWNKTAVDTCCNKKVDTYSLDTSACRDFTSSEKTSQRNAWESQYSGHSTYVGDATYTYNCHGLVFHSGSVWGGDPANWEGPENPCYEEKSDGSIYRWGSSHSSIAGSAYTYRAKCGREILCDHDNTIYGTHSKRWKQRPSN